MESGSTLVGLHEGNAQSSTLRARQQQAGQSRDTTSTTTSSILKTARNAKAKAWTTRSRVWQVMALAAFVTAAWTFYFIFATPGGYEGYTLGEIQSRILGNLFGKAHVWGGGISMALGPFQFLASPRRTGKAGRGNPRNSVHSWIGRVYNVCVIAGGIGSLDIIKKSDVYDFGWWGFVVLGALWAITAALGWIAMVGDKPDIESHKKWMKRNFALTYAAVMLRWQLPILLHYGMTLKYALSLTGWTCWVPNVIFVDLI